LTQEAERLRKIDMQDTYSTTRGRRQFPAMLRAAQRRGVAVVTKDDTTVAYLVSRDKWEAMLETMELLANPDFQRQLRRLRAGKVKYSTALSD
jgi:prevent-host-death family protein